jgi:hypothetical protein
MGKIITVRMDHPEFEPQLIRGFRFFWAFWVKGFNPAHHCQPCFKGKRVDEFCTGTAKSGQCYSMQKPDDCRYLYICGVGKGPKSLLHEQNFHLALEFQGGGTLSDKTYNNYAVNICNAVKLTIPALPLGWKGRDRETTRCKNFQFAVEYFGYSDG